MEAFEIPVLEVTIMNKLSSCSVPMSQTYSHSIDVLSTYPGPVADRLQAFHPLTTLQSK